MVRGRPIQTPEESPMPRRGICGLESANRVTKKPRQTRVRSEFTSKISRKPGFREIPVWRCSTPTATSGAAQVDAGDREADTLSVTTPREREATMHHAACDEQSPSPHHRHRHWLHHSVHVDRSSHELRLAHKALSGAKTPSTVSVWYSTSRSLSITCSVSANNLNILPLGRAGSSTSPRMA